MKKNVKILILSLIILSSLILEVTSFSVKLGASYAYVIKPMIWFFIGIITFVFFKNEIITNEKYKKEVNFVILVATLVYFLIYFILGYIKGFAYNPYDSSLKGILTNLWTFLPVLCVREYVRYYMINNCDQKRILYWTLFISLLFVFVDLNIYKFDTYFASPLTTTAFFIETFIPDLITNLFLTYISYFSNYKTTIIYSLLPQLALYTFPILPDVDWATLAILNSTIPFFTYIYVNYMINQIDKTYDRKVEKTVGLKSWLGMIASVVIMACFGLGMFPLKPLVIASNSMAPEIHRGDIVLIKDTDVKKVRKGEVIRYKIDDYYVVHRVVDIKEDDNGKRLFVTKGDNNDSVDLYPVKESQFAGSVKYDVAYLGYPTLILGELLKTDVDDKVIVDKGKTS